MGLANYLFSFSGRINRAKQWAILLVGIAYEFVLGIVFAATIGFGAFVTMVQNHEPIGTLFATPQAEAFGVFLLLSYFLLLYISLAIATKRLHDRDKSAWWLLVFFLLPVVLNIPTYLQMLEVFRHFNSYLNAAQNGGTPPQLQANPLATIGNGAATIISLWAFVELFCLQGTVGPNRYGADPLAR